MTIYTLFKIDLKYFEEGFFYEKKYKSIIKFFVGVLLAVNTLDFHGILGHIAYFIFGDDSVSNTLKKGVYLFWQDILGQYSVGIYYSFKKNTNQGFKNS